MILHRFKSGNLNHSLNRICLISRLNQLKWSKPLRPQTKMSLTLTSNILIISTPSVPFVSIASSETRSLHLNIWSFASFSFAFSRCFGEIPFGIAQKLRHNFVAVFLTQLSVPCLRRCKRREIVMRYFFIVVDILQVFHWRSQVREHFPP